MTPAIHYEKYRLARIVSVQEIVSADYVEDYLAIAPRHSHEEAWELTVCLRGEASVLRETIYVPLNAGDIILIPPGMYHDITISKAGTAAFAISFTCSNSEHLRPLQDRIQTGGEALLRVFEQIIQEVQVTFSSSKDQMRLYHFVPSTDPPLGAEHMICSYLEQILITLLRASTMNQGQIVRTGQLQEAIHTYLAEQIAAHIDEHIHERLTVEQIAAHFHYSRARLSTIYKGITGCGINETITNKRIERAKRMLLSQTKSIAQISEDLGFSSPQYFSHKFTQIVGCSPSRFAEFSTGKKNDV